MLYNLVPNLEYCGSFVSGVSDLLLYSHIPAMVVSLVLGLFVFLKNKTLLLGKILALISTFFAVWGGLNLAIWFNYANAGVLMFAWSLIEVFSVLLFILCFYFVLVFVREKDLLLWQKILLFAPLLPIILFASTDFYLAIYDLQECVAWEEKMYIDYVRLVKISFAAVTLLFLGYTLISPRTKTIRRKIGVLAAGILGFLFSFMVAGYLAEQTVNYTYEFYGLFAMVWFIGTLAYLIVKYAAFDIKLIATQILVLSLVFLIGAQFFFYSGVTDLIINVATFLLSSIFGYFLVQSVKREVALREQLQVMNKQQVETMRFITHEVKGYLTDSSGAFDALLTDTFGPINDETRAMVKEALAKDQKAIADIKEFLRISDFKTGRVAYQIQPFDFKKTLEDALPMLEENAKKKGLTLSSHIAPGNYRISGDADQLTSHLIGNLINNATNYTPSGSITVSLSRSGKRVIFSVKDTGIGLTPEDMQVLFTEGGRGEESRNINPHSTGYGLFIAKKIVEAHGGRIWAESPGRGHGSTFFVDLPALA